MKLRKYRILITGGTGFIGRHLSERLLADGHVVRIMSRGHTQTQQVAAGASYLCGDFTNNEDVITALEDIDIVYHLAVTTFPGTSNEKIQFDARTNLLGSINLMEQAAIADVERFVFVSSGGTVYGPTAHEPVAETNATEPASAHGVSKLAIEKYLEVIRRHYGMSYRVARGANPYGEGQRPGRGQGFIATALGRIARGEAVEVWGDGSVVRDYVYIKDFVEALELMLDDDGPHTVYNVGSGVDHSIDEIIALLEEVTGESARVNYVSARPADVPFNCLDVSRIQEALGWQPRTPIHMGITRTWMWVRELVREDSQLIAAESRSEDSSPSVTRLQPGLSGAN